ncbi:MAG: RdgB/HAM1 family non-canonical purine NTP pyrophosphatase [Bacteroidales bacterium]|nr:RdgB/HAM1 family non-canonical purine NTP pyrophosphatase [Bacteroidales bacterium]MCL2129861.1 RdgB/HAM1 family non-canonical purine NTP pyrophosphatase [Treponema sp.]
MKLIFATANQHKAEEVRALLGRAFTLLTPNDLGYTEDIPETGNTLEDNALEKARFIWKKFGLPCFSDDTGFEVEALNGAPGVFSARYAGEARDPKANMQLVLREMEGKTLRTARFRCVVALIMEGKETCFEGMVNGSILTAPQGEQGFGYDPVFRPDGYDCSFAELDLEEKNKISHRGQAISKLVDFLRQYEQPHL